MIFNKGCYTGQEIVSRVEHIGKTARRAALFACGKALPTGSDITDAGGTVAGRMAVLAEGDAQNRDDIIYLNPLPLFNADGTVKE